MPLQSTRQILPQTATQVLKLPNYQLLLIAGPEAAKFLQGQVTCDINELNNHTSRLGAQCTVKGRVILSFRALQITPELIALRIPHSMMESALASLGKYIVFSKAKLDIGSEFHLFGISGSNATNVAQTFFKSTPAQINDWTEEKGCYLVKLADDRFECWIHRAALDLFNNTFNSQLIKEDTNKWALLDIQAGISDIVPLTRELFTPQELNYQLINAVSFRKGCYTGQEIVARLHYRGKLKRHLFRLEAEGNALPLLGTSIHSSSGQACGHITQVAFSATSKFELLVSMLAEHQNDAYFSTLGEKLKPLGLPYAIPSAEELSD